MEAVKSEPYPSTSITQNDHLDFIANLNLLSYLAAQKPTWLFLQIIRVFEKASSANLPTNGGTVDYRIGCSDSLYQLNHANPVDARFSPSEFHYPALVELC